MDCQKDRDLAQPTRIGEGRGEGFSLAQTRQDTLIMVKWLKRRAQGKPKVDGLLTRVTRLRQMREGAERLLEIPHSLAMSRLRHGLLPRLLAVRHGLVPHLPLQGMMR